jgi:hypothetical protein
MVKLTEFCPGSHYPTMLREEILRCSDQTSMEVNISEGLTLCATIRSKSNAPFGLEYGDRNRNRVADDHCPEFRL